MFEWSYCTWQNAAWLNLTEIIFRFFATNIVKYDKIGEVIYPDGTLFLQFVSDNTDHDMATIYGNNTHHRLGSIAIANDSFADISVSRERVPWDKREAWCKVNFNEDPDHSLNGFWYCLETSIDLSLGILFHLNSSTNTTYCDGGKI